MFSWAAQQQTRLNQLSLTGALHFRSVSPAFVRLPRSKLHCCHIPAASSCSFDPSGCRSWSLVSLGLAKRPSAYLTSSTCTVRCTLYHHTLRPPPHRLPAQAIAAAPRAPVAIAASAPTLPLPAITRCPPLRSLRGPLDLPCLAAFARAPAATHLPHPPVAPE